MAEEYLAWPAGSLCRRAWNRSTIRRADENVEPFRPGAILFNGDAIQIEPKYFATPSDYVGIFSGVTSLVFSTFAFLSMLK